jgi:hypothetical protein
MIGYIEGGVVRRRDKADERKAKEAPEVKRQKPRGWSNIDEGTPFNPYLKAAILEVVENQIRHNDPPETRQALERLLGRGYSRTQATEMIGSAVVEEIWAIMHDHKPFERARFAALLGN